MYVTLPFPFLSFFFSFPLLPYPYHPYINQHDSLVKPISQNALISHHINNPQPNITNPNPPPQIPCITYRLPQTNTSPPPSQKVRPRAPLNLQHRPGRGSPHPGHGGYLHSNDIPFPVNGDGDTGDDLVGSEDEWGVSWYVLVVPFIVSGLFFFFFFWPGWVLVDLFGFCLCGGRRC